MQFNIKSTKIKINFTFFALILIIICCDNSKILTYSIISSIIHELTHVFFILIFGGVINEFSVTFSGCKIERLKNKITSNFKECFISLSAPLVNISIGAFSLFYFKNDAFGLINIAIGVFNILPFYNFDGGRGLYYFLSSKASEKSIRNILTITSVLSVILMSFVTVTALKQNEKSISIVILNFYMILYLVFNLKSETNVKNI